MLPTNLSLSAPLRLILALLLLFFATIYFSHHSLNNFVFPAVVLSAPFPQNPAAALSAPKLFTATNLARSSSPRRTITNNDYTPLEKILTPPPSPVKTAPKKVSQIQISVPKTIPPVSTPVPPTDLEAIFTDASQKYAVSKDKLMKIAKCESNFHTNSVNPGGPYLGMYQYLESTWVSTRKAMGADPNPVLVYDPKEAINTSAWKIAHGGLDAWPVCGKL